MGDVLKPPGEQSAVTKNEEIRALRLFFCASSEVVRSCLRSDNDKGRRLVELYKREFLSNVFAGFFTNKAESNIISSEHMFGRADAMDLFKPIFQPQYLDIYC